MKLKSFGCSFIYGTDLADDGRGFARAAPSKLTWPSLLAQKRQWEYECFAWPGAGNLQILEQVLNQLADPEPSVYVIGWTWIDRFDYTATDAARPWRTIMPVDTDHTAEVYYKNIHSEYRDKLTTLLNIKTAIDTLQQRKQRFIMTAMDALAFDRRWNTSAAIAELQNYCEPYITSFEGKNFLDWSRSQGFEISPGWHPLEAAHRGAADLVACYNLV